MDNPKSLDAWTRSAYPLFLLPVTEIAIARIEALEAALASLRRLGVLRPVRGWRPLDGVRRAGPRVRGPAGLSLVRKPQARRLRRRPSTRRRRLVAVRVRRPAATRWRDRNH